MQRWSLVLAFLPVVALAQRPDRAALEEAVKKDPADGRAWLALGGARQAAHDLDGAATAYRRALELKVRVPAALYNLACVSALRGQPDEAFDWLKKATAAGFGNLDAAKNDPDLAS